MDKARILEALKMQPLSEEEKATRHILARLYGPIATSNDSTRNGRKYNKELWEKALADELFKEKINYKSLFLELGHPVGREETDMAKVCACIPEMPKIVNGDLYAYVDILDTDNGRLLKTLCDYGFVPGISSRGSGDIMPGDEVDPETFFLETWDIVQLPAVKIARLAMCESVDVKAVALKKALNESLAKADSQARENMKEALDNLEISIEESPLIEEDEIPWSEEEDLLVEDATSEEEIQEDSETEVEEEDIPEATEESDSEIEENADIDVGTVGELIAQLTDYDAEMPVVFNPIVVENTEYIIDGIDVDSTNDSVCINISYSQVIGDNIDEVDETETVDETTAVSDEDVSEEEAETEEEADDIGDVEVMESLKELIRQKDLLENENKALKSSKTVSDAEVKELKESLEQYKLAFARTSELAGKAKAFEKQIEQLQEQLSQKEVDFSNLQKEHLSRLTESVDSTNRKIADMKKQFTAREAEWNTTENSLNEQVNVYKTKLSESVRIAKQYQARCNEAVSKYIDFRASMLGVKATEITNRLNRGYTMTDVDNVCDAILTESVNINKLPYGLDRDSKVIINESKTAKPRLEYGYDIDDSLLELAGLKK